MEIIDQTRLPHDLVLVELRQLDDYCRAIDTMQVRGAPLIGITAAHALASCLRADPSPESEQKARQKLLATRPTAINLRWALERVQAAIAEAPLEMRAAVALREARALEAEDVATCEAIGAHGLPLLQQLAETRKGATLQVLTHCNAGWLAALQWGTALAPIYQASAAGLEIHVWVSETRPRNQGLSLTCWELADAGIAHTVITDSAAGHLLQAGRVDCCLVGSDRTVANGDVCNKVGTYLKALAAQDNQVPFYVALPTSTIDWECADGAGIPIEERAESEVLHMPGRDQEGREASVRLGAEATRAFNPAFDVTPARLVTALITEFGVVAPGSLQQLRDIARSKRC
ncbi:MAG: S-methyl-5-thioribose-1-phosphate isomerase [Gammaproteobacteria bacterium]|nr:S-methyl-5-thioribose-1-phosphate isomerase [Gammaproteobacteria bacterium]